MEHEEEGNHELVVAAQNNLLSTQQAVDVAARAARAAVDNKAQAERIQAEKMSRQTSFLADILSSQAKHGPGSGGLAVGMHGWLQNMLA